MDNLERKVLRGPGTAYCEKKTALALDSAKRAWDIEVGLEPAYVEVIAIDHGICKNRLLVEIDGVRIGCFEVVADAHIGHYWDLSERGVPNTDLSLTALDNKRVINRRRKRLQKRGLYNG